jgi:hypothetical protein
MVSIYGLYFKSWLICLAAGFAAAFIFTRIVELTPARNIFRNVMILPALTVIFSYAVWAAFFMF